MNMFESFVMLIILFSVFGGLFAVAHYTNKLRLKQSNYSVGKVIASFPISCKSQGIIVKIGEKYYFCCEGSGIIEIEYDEPFDMGSNSNTFKEILAKELNVLNKVKGNKNEIN